MSTFLAPPLQTARTIYDVAAPAKLNLFLHITGRRDDGYHLLQSVFMLIDWCDTLHFELRQDGVISREDLNASASEPLPAEDLTVRAARALQRISGTSLGVHIGLKKNIPKQAGMGGGSSNAASCLLALQRLWGLRLPAPTLHQLALSLGADVPFFLSGGHAWVEGIGDEITPISLPDAKFLVIHPGQGLSTPAIFSAKNLKRDSQTATLLGFAANASDQIFKYGRNDLQPVAQSLCPAINQSLQWLLDRQLSGRMTGSGSAVFAQMLHGIDISTAPSEWSIQSCNNLRLHPLTDW